MKEAIIAGWALLWRVGLLLGTWQFFLRLSQEREVASAESNLIANQIGIQEAARADDPDLVLVGSSLTVRLQAGVLGREAGLPEVVQMGLNGSGSVMGLQLLGELGVRPGFLVVEANSLSRAANQNEQTLLHHLDEGVFWLARALPWVRAKNRPSSLLYHRLKQWRDGRLPPLPVGEREVVPPGFAQGQGGDRSEETLAIASRVGTLVERLEVPWERVLLVMLPDRGRERSRSYAVARILVEQHGAKILDLKGWEEPGDYRYADGLHLNAPGGRKASIQVARALREMGAASRE